MPRPVAPVLLLLGGACACGSPSECDLALVGDPGEPPAIKVVTVEDDVIRSIADGDDCGLVAAPQGGHVVLAAARVRNMSAGAVQLTGWLLDRESGQAFGLESRPINLVESEGEGDGEEGWAEPARPDSLASYSNIAACPSANLPRDVHDQAWVLAVRVEDCAGRTVEAAVEVTPRCASDAAPSCTCQCDMDYRLGDPCPQGIQVVMR